MQIEKFLYFVLQFSKTDDFSQFSRHLRLGGRFIDWRRKDAIAEFLAPASISNSTPGHYGHALAKRMRCATAEKSEKGRRPHRTEHACEQSLEN